MYVFSKVKFYNFGFIKFTVYSLVVFQSVLILYVMVESRSKELPEILQTYINIFIFSYKENSRL